MAKKNKITENHTLEQYDKRYGKAGLRKVLKKDAENNSSVLEGSSWWLIEDTYYELPKNPVGYWWKNLSRAGKIALCVLGVGAVTTAVVVPTVIGINQKVVAKTKDATKSGDGLDIINSVTFTQQEDGSYKATLSLAEGHTKDEIESITIKVGDTVLVKDTDYTIENDVIVIKKDKVQENSSITIEIKKKVTPSVVHVTGVTLNETETKLTVGETLQLKETVLPSNATNKNVTWESSDKNIAEVDNNGKVTAKAAGNVTITVKSEDDESKFAQCKIEVADKVITREEWIKKLDEILASFNESSLEYGQDDIEFYNAGQKEEIEDITYTIDNNIRSCIVKEGSSQNTIANGETNAQLLSLLLDENEPGVKYSIKDDEIVYSNSKPSTLEGTISIGYLSFNIYGYTKKTTMVYSGYAFESEYIYKGAPHEAKTLIDKETFIENAGELFNTFNNAETEYSLNNIYSVTVNNNKAGINSVEYGDKTETDDRSFIIKTDIDDIDVCESRYYDEDFLGTLLDPNGKFYKYTNGAIEYTTEKDMSTETYGGFRSLKFNKYGYLENYNLYIKSEQDYFSTKIVYVGAPQEVIPSEKFISKCTALSEEYSYSASVYSSSKISFTKISNGEETQEEVTNVTYKDNPNTASRGTNITTASGDTFIDITSNIEAAYTYIMGNEDKSCYKYNEEGSIEFYNENAEVETLKSFKVNEYGYLTEFIMLNENGKEDGYKIEYKGAPEEIETPVIVKTIYFDSASFSNAISNASGNKVSATLKTLSVSEDSSSKIINFEYTAEEQFGFELQFARIDKSSSEVTVIAATTISFEISSSTTSSYVEIPDDVFESCDDDETIHFIIIASKI